MYGRSETTESKHTILYPISFRLVETKYPFDFHSTILPNTFDESSKM